MASDALTPQPKVEEVKTGISRKDNKEISGALCQALADTFTLYLKTLGVHWNVVGPAFYSLHKLTQDQYEDLNQAIDEIAERVRALGQIAPASFGDFAAQSVIDSTSTLTTTREMIETLITDNEAVALRMREFVNVADSGDDVFTADLLTRRIGQHEENAWMLRAMNAS